MLYTDENLFGGPFYWNASADYLKTDNEDATVNGGFQDDDLALFEIDRFDGGATLGWRSNAGELELYSKRTTIEGRIGWGSRDLKPHDAVSSIEAGIGKTATAQRYAGLGKQISLLSIGGRIAYDDRDFEVPVRQLSHPLIYHFPGRVLLQRDGAYHSFRDITFPESGGLLQVEADYVTGSDEARFLRLGAEVQRFRTLFWRNRIVAVRARLDKVHGIDDGIIPYPDLPTLGGSQRLRGYKRGSLRGEGTLLLSIEYRWPIWDTWNAFLFHEEGQMFDEYGDIDPGEFNSSFGAGVSLRTAEAFLISARIAHSAEETALLGFSLEQEF